MDEAKVERLPLRGIVLAVAIAFVAFALAGLAYITYTAATANDGVDCRIENIERELEDVDKRYCG